MAFSQLKEHRYISLKTFRRSGEGVPTPVWFAQAGDVLYVTTRPNSGKVKRIRHNPAIEIAPCDVRGNLLGDYQPAHAVIVNGDAIELAFRALEDKYRDTDMWQNTVKGRADGQRAFLAIREA